MSVPTLNRVSALYLPNSVDSVLKESDHPDIPWAPPATLPPPNDLLAALRTLEGRMHPLSERVLLACFAHLVAIFEPGTKIGQQETNLRLAAWKAACGDIPDDLFQKATELACSSLKWMPKPVELRELVAAQLERRTGAIARVKQMMTAAPEQGPFKAEPLAVRVRSMRDSFKNVGKILKAAQYERELAGMENREIEDWARDVQVDQPKTERPPFKPDTSPSGKRCAELAKSFHTGKPPAEHRDIPEVA